MFASLLLILQCFTIFSVDFYKIIVNAEITSRIVNGDDASVGQFPYMVSLRQGNEHFCGGSILSNYWILTASHCIYQQQAVNIVAHVGITKLNEQGPSYKISKLFPHPAYNELALYFVSADAGLVKTVQPIQFVENLIQPIKLGKNFVSGGFLPSTQAVASGWGYTSAVKPQVSNSLKFLKTKIINRHFCRILLFPLVVPFSEICTISSFGKGMCPGDSGSPLIVIDKKNEKIQVGIVSKVIPCGVGLPDMYARVSYYFNWIKEIIRLN